jgi:pyruvate/2-oxoglutarate dehydrogenase complex dihydrolipoamide dehydrogenase (E3) component
MRDAPVNTCGRDQEEEEKHMPQSEQVEVLVLGSGTGGKLIAWYMAQSGRRTAVVEAHWVGGSCPNIACMPSKNEISSAKVAQLARDGRHYGTVTGSVTVNMAIVRQRKREMVERDVEALELDYLPQHLIVIGGGYSGPGLAQAFRRFGSDVIIIESGPQLLAREDIDVSQEMRRILSGEGIQVLVEGELVQVGGRSGDKVTLTVRTPSGEQQIDGSDILVAVGLEGKLSDGVTGMSAGADFLLLTL